ncbi:MAG: tetratricopeptide repeat protein, partial [Betaproteobacteria bacterium]
MSRVLVDQLRALAHRLGGGTIAGRPDSTRKFWLIAGQLRAAFPPLLLAVRTGSPQQRIGYLLTAGSAWPNRLRLIENEHGAGNERVCLYLHGEFREIAGISWAKVVDLNPLNEIQAARLIAEDDLDLLVDIDGGMLQAMPAMIALHPARRLVEAAFVPVVTGDSATMSNEPLAPADPHAVIDAARRALDALPEAPSPTLDSPATLNARLNRGIQMHQASELAAAHGVYRDVLAHVPGHPVAAYLLGQLLFQQGRLDESIAALRAAIESAPEFRDAHYTLAQRLVDA